MRYIYYKTVLAFARIVDLFAAKGRTSKYDRDKFMDKADAEAFARIVRASTDVPVEVK
ncbi:MAG: hypothetical protein IJG50_00035 [Clostridia bacterium]|nr:hypothetical protein [Clostridia bacterium]